MPLQSGGFIPVYYLNSSTTLVNSSNIVAGNYRVVEELNASNQMEIRIRPVVQSNGNWVDFGANQFYRTNSSYPNLSSVLNYISSNNINAVNVPSGDTITILAPGNGSQVTSSNDDLHVYITYQSNGGGYQTPTWAYKIDSGFPAYGSPHGGTHGGSTQVVGSTYGQAKRYLEWTTLWAKADQCGDQGGNMHNPPITQSISVNYQSTGGGYQSGGGGYQTHQSGDTITYSSPGGRFSGNDQVHFRSIHWWRLPIRFTSPISQTEAVTRHPHGHIRSIPVSRHMDHPMVVLRLSVQLLLMIS